MPERNMDNGEELKAVYWENIQRYISLHDRIRALHTRSEESGAYQFLGGEDYVDKRIDQINELDNSRHNLHLELIAMGGQLGKSDSEVIADILQAEGNLGEYDLPEYAVTSFRFLGVDDEESKEKDKISSIILFYSDKAPVDYFSQQDTEDFDFDQYEKEVESAKGYGFDQNSIDNGCLFGRVIIDDKIKKAQALAHDTGSELLDYENLDYSYHDIRRFVGVVVPKDKIAEIASEIILHKDKYGLEPENIDSETQARIKQRAEIYFNVVYRRYLSFIQKYPQEETDFKKYLRAKTLEANLNSVFGLFSEEELDKILEQIKKAYQEKLKMIEEERHLNRQAKANQAVEIKQAVEENYYEDVQNQAEIDEIKKKHNKPY